MMKKMTVIAMLLGLFCLSAGAKGKQPIAFQKLPKEVQKAALQNYTNEDILFITKQKELGKDHYAFMLADDTKIEFFENGKVYKVKSEKGVMDVFIPEVILKYTNATFPNSTITAYKNEGWRQKLEINNSVNIIFSRKGKFLSIEDF